MIWVMRHPQATVEMLGFIPEFLSENDPRPAREQFAANYVSGWSPFKGFKVAADGSSLRYPDDPPQLLIAETRLRDEVIRFYDGSWVGVFQPDGSYEISRMD